MACRCLTHKGAGVNASECDRWKAAAFHPGFRGTAPSFGAPTRHAVALVAVCYCCWFFYLWFIDVLKIFGEMISKEEKVSQNLYFGVGFPFLIFNAKAL